MSEKNPSVLTVGGFKVIAGRHTTRSAVDVIDVDLQEVLSVLVSFEAEPCDDAALVTAAAGHPDAGHPHGTVVIRTWGKPCTPNGWNEPATRFGRFVHWIAVGK